jgi:hypothetical protein
MNGHHLAHYVIAGVLAVAGGAALWVEHGRVSEVQARPPVVVYHPAPGGSSIAESAPRPNRFAWPSLGEQGTIQLGEALQKAGPAKVIIFCASEHCKDLEADIDDAFQIAGWADQEEGQVLVNGEEEGFIVGPPGAKADALKAGLGLVGLGPIAVAPMNVRGADVGLIIAKRPKGK